VEVNFSVLELIFTQAPHTLRNMSSDSHRDFTILIYRDSARPRIMRLKPATIRFFFWLAPLAVLAIITVGVLSSGLTKSTLENQYESQDFELRDLQEQLRQLQNKYTSLKREVGLGAGVIPPEEVSTGESEAKEISEESFLPVSQFTHSNDPSIGVVIRGFRKSITSDGTLVFDFRLEKTESKRGESLSGYVIVAGLGSGVIGIYPGDAAHSSSQMIAPQKGESFRFSRLRPVRARFENLPNPKDVRLFKIYLFKRDGTPLIQTIWEEKPNS
jgi:hypothetical protein